MFNSRKAILLISSIILFFAISSFVSAQYLECSMKTSCDAGETSVISMSSPENAHAGQPSAYGYKICCSGLSNLQVETSSSSVNDFFVSLSGTANAHSSITPSDYSNDYYLTTSDGVMECNFENPCTTRKECVFEMSGVTNAHVSNCSDYYPLKVCCGLYLFPITIRNLGVTGVEQLNQEYTSQRSVYLILNFRSDAVACRYVNHDNASDLPAEDNYFWTAWETCVSNRLWMLTENPGEKTVYYEINYSSGTEIYNDSIIFDYTGSGLDLTPPSAPTIIYPEYTNNNTNIEISWAGAYDPESDLFNIPLRYNAIAYDNTGTVLSRSPNLTTTTYTFPFSPSLSHGDFIYFNVTVINSANLTGNATTYPDGTTIDLVAPTMNAPNGEGYNLSYPQTWQTLPTTDWLHASSVKFDWSASDADSYIYGYSFIVTKDTSLTPDYIPDGVFGSSNAQNNKTYSNLDSGSYVFRIMVRDAAGNWDSSYEEYPFKIDSTGPTAPVLVSEVKAGNDVTYTWTQSSDSESDVVGYNISLVNISNFKIYYSAFETGKSSTTHQFTNVPTGTFNITIGAKNGAGIYTWSNPDIVQTDFEPPVIIALPNTTVVANRPILKVWTDEQAVCYYNTSGEAITKFSFTNNTYHETKSKKTHGTPDHPYYTITCADGWNNQADITIDFPIDTTLSVNYATSSVSSLTTYEGVVTTLPTIIYHSISMPCCSVAKLTNINKNDIKLNLGSKSYEYSVFDTGNGEFNFSFIAPDAGDYTLNLVISGTTLLSIPMHVDPLRLSTAYQGTLPASEQTKRNLEYSEDSNSRIGLATNSKTKSFAGSGLNISNVDVNDKILIFNTRPETSITDKDNKLGSDSFLDRINPSFGYALDDKYSIQLILDYNDYLLTSEVGQTLGEGQHNIHIVRSSNVEDNINIKFENYQGQDSKVVLR